MAIGHADQRRQMGARGTARNRNAIRTVSVFRCLRPQEANRRLDVLDHRREPCLGGLTEIDAGGGDAVLDELSRNVGLGAIHPPATMDPHHQWRGGDAGRHVQVKREVLAADGRVDDVFLRRRCLTGNAAREEQHRGDGDGDQALHDWTPDIWARTLKSTAKSSFARPMPRAAVRNSLVTAVVGRGTSSRLPISSASIMSFCIMLTSNQTSSGILSTKGPRYCTIGEAMTLWVSTSTATSREMPLFSASSTPSLNASICTARLRLWAILSDSARPLSPTWVTLGPTSSSMGLMRSKVARLPPTITLSLPASSVATLPDTGESTMSAPFSRTLSATVRLTAGLTVLMSTTTLSLARPVRNPSAPVDTPSSALESVTITKITSAACATALGESPHFMPRSINHCALERVRLYPVTVCPLSSSRFAMRLPMAPSPMYPRLAID